MKKDTKNHAATSRVQGGAEMVPGGGDAHGIETHRLLAPHGTRAFELPIRVGTRIGQRRSSLAILPAMGSPISRHCTGKPEAGASLQASRTRKGSW
jgi:hypothetical protein